MVGFSGKADGLFAIANQTASEAFTNIRTVPLFPWCQHDIVTTNPLVARCACASS